MTRGKRARVAGLTYFLPEQAIASWFSVGLGISCSRHWTLWSFRVHAPMYYYTCRSNYYIPWLLLVLFLVNYKLLLLISGFSLFMCLCMSLLCLKSYRFCVHANSVIYYVTFSGEFPFHHVSRSARWQCWRDGRGSCQQRCATVFQSVHCL